MDLFMPSTIIIAAIHNIPVRTLTSAHQRPNPLTTFSFSPFPTLMIGFASSRSIRKSKRDSSGATATATGATSGRYAPLLGAKAFVALIGIAKLNANEKNRRRMLLVYLTTNRAKENDLPKAMYTFTSG
jgi:hypothetical protein